jgi:tetratricopeptide (TPR) repeat protein
MPPGGSSERAGGPGALPGMVIPFRPRSYGVDTKPSLPPAVRSRGRDDVLMTTTLIVRDATLAINGAPEKRGEPREFLRGRVEDVATMDQRTAEECAEVLGSVAHGEGADPEVVQALVIVALAQPALAAHLKLPTTALGRRLAARLERDGEVERAMAVLELLLQHFPGEDALERDLAQLMRRQGMVQDLTNRYFARAQKLIREGRINEAAGWLREVLQLDPSRKDAARVLRNLRFKRTVGVRKRGGGFRFVLVTAALVIGVAFGVLREVRLRAALQAVPEAPSGNVVALKRRLVELDAFSERHPIWHGALDVLSERSELRVQVSVLEEKARAESEAHARAERERLENAELCRRRGLDLAQSGDLRGALDVLRQALVHGGPDWERREEVLRDVEALEEHFREQQ